MEKTVQIGGKDCRLKTSAALPRIYRLYVGREIFEDVHKIISTLLRSAQASTDPTVAAPAREDQLEAVTLGENLAYAMHKHGDPSQPNTVEGWLEQFDDEAALADPALVIELVTLWNHDSETTSSEKKKKEQSTGE